MYRAEEERRPKLVNADKCYIVYFGERYVMGFLKDIQQSTDANIANSVKLVDESLVMEQVSRKSIPK